MHLFNVKIQANYLQLGEYGEMVSLYNNFVFDSYVQGLIRFVLMSKTRGINLFDDTAICSGDMKQRPKICEIARLLRHATNQRPPAMHLGSSELSQQDNSAVQIC